MNQLANNAIGTLAALCSMASFFPQVLKLYREKDASAVSGWMYGVTITGFALWIGYGVALNSWPLIAANGVCAALSAAILGLKLRYDRRRADKKP